MHGNLKSFKSCQEREETLKVTNFDICELQNCCLQKIEFWIWCVILHNSATIFYGYKEVIDKSLENSIPHFKKCVTGNEGIGIAAMHRQRCFRHSRSHSHQESILAIPYDILFSFQRYSLQVERYIRYYR